MPGSFDEIFFSDDPLNIHSLLKLGDKHEIDDGDYEEDERVRWLNLIDSNDGCDDDSDIFGVTDDKLSQ